MSFRKMSAEQLCGLKVEERTSPGKMFPEIGKSTFPIEGAAKGRAKTELAMRRQFTK